MANGKPSTISFPRCDSVRRIESGEPRFIGKGRLPTNNLISIALLAASTLPLSKPFWQPNSVDSEPGSGLGSYRHQGNGCQVNPRGLPHAALRKENTSTKEQCSTKLKTDSHRSTRSNGKPSIWDSKSSKPLVLKKRSF